ncbi:hypothetical protein LCGC14_1446400 [marine sediment metagenome]|uniref:HTH arsR-type domain-containing protein n=1 Tax=marine sediment metagenome TaxID=412755 RepID=A0A0F9ML11_9ZZZZ
MNETNASKILNVLNEEILTSRDISKELDIPLDKVKNSISSLKSQNLIKVIKIEKNTFYYQNREAYMKRLLVEVAKWNMPIIKAVVFDVIEESFSFKPSKEFKKYFFNLKESIKIKTKYI